MSEVPMIDQKKKELVMSVAKAEADELIASAERYEKLAAIEREKAAKILELASSSGEASSMMLPQRMREVIYVENIPVKRMPIMMTPASTSYCGAPGHRAMHRAWFLPR